MDYQKLGPHGPTVSRIGLGTMTWGEQNNPDDAFAQLDMATERGVTLIDVAEMYPVPPRAETQGRTEEILGAWLNQRGHHDDLVIATKVTGRADWVPWIRGGPQLDPASIVEACEGSLKRLGIDCIDLYQVHWPDRPTNYFGRLGYEDLGPDSSVPIEVTLEALSQLVRDGKIRHIGISNETPWGLSEYLRLAGSNTQLSRVVSVQNPYNLLNRTYEIGLAEFAARSDVGLLAYSPLAFGMLSGKYENGARPEGARLSLYKRFSRYSGPESLAATSAYAALARQSGLTPTQLALAFVNQQPFLRSNLIGATTLAQLEENLGSAEIKLSDDVLAGIAAIHQQHPNPAP